MRSSLMPAVVGLLAGLAGGCQQGSVGDAMPMFPPPSVTIAHPVTASVTDHRYYTGRFEAVERVDLRARVKGFLQKVHFQEGAEVQAGDLLYDIDPRTFHAELAKAEAEVVRLQSQLKLATSEADRSRRLRSDRANSEEEFVQKMMARDTTEAALKAAEAVVDSCKLELSFCKVTAPIAGRIGRTLVTEGNLVGANEPTLLTTIVRLDPLYLVFEAPERDYLDYQVLRRADHLPAHTDRQLPVELGLDNEKGYPHTGVIDFQDNQIDPGTGTILVRAVVPNANRQLAPGLFARVRAPFGKPAPRIVVPEQVVSTDQRGRYVLAVAGDCETVEYRTVTTGPTFAGFTVIEKGVSTDDWVIVNGMVKARPGGKVTAEKGTIKPPTADAVPAVPTVAAIR